MLVHLHPHLQVFLSIAWDLKPECTEGLTMKTIQARFYNQLIG